MGSSLEVDSASAGRHSLGLVLGFAHLLIQCHTFNFIPKISLILHITQIPENGTFFMGSFHVLSL